VLHSKSDAMVRASRDKVQLARCKFEAQGAQQMLDWLEADGSRPREPGPAARRPHEPGPAAPRPLRLGGEQDSESESEDEGARERERERNQDSESEHESEERGEQGDDPLDDPLAKYIVSLPNQLQGHPKLHAFEVARLHRRIYVSIDVPWFRRINHLLVVDGIKRRLLLVSFLSWDIVQVPFEWIRRMWDASHADYRALGLEIEVLRPPRASCGVRLRGASRVYRLYFRTVPHVHAGVIAQGRRDAGRFDFDGAGRISQL
jgi:hypothetical protein